MARYHGRARAVSVRLLRPPAGAAPGLTEGHTAAIVYVVVQTRCGLGKGIYYPFCQCSSWRFCKERIVFTTGTTPRLCESRKTRCLERERDRERGGKEEHRRTTRTQTDPHLRTYTYARTYTQETTKNASLRPHASAVPGCVVFVIAGALLLCKTKTKSNFCARVTRTEIRRLT